MTKMNDANIEAPQICCMMGSGNVLSRFHRVRRAQYKKRPVQTHLRPREAVA
jgi:hypothetical protein